MVVATLKETPLANTHRQSGAKMVDFAGWNMPVQYKSIIAEHLAVRNDVGLFDVSHMGEFIVSGAEAKPFLQKIIANDIEKLTEPNRALYTQLVNENGGTVDDIIVYRRENDYLVVVNAANIEKDWHWFKKQAGAFKQLEMVDESNNLGLIAVQGPKAFPLMHSLVGDVVKAMGSFHYAHGKIGNADVSFGRTGYTGEDGFEIFVPVKDTAQVWQTLIKAGEAFNIQPCGLGARDTLRLEACLPLYGHELDDETSPLEAGLGWSVKLAKGPFVGSDKLTAQKQNGLPKQLVCLVSEGKALPRQGYPVKADGKVIGTVTSGSQGIFVGYPIAFAYVEPTYAKVGQPLAVEIRGNEVPAKVVQRPFYKAQAAKESKS
jgi:aminomethyltransferase